MAGVPPGWRREEVPRKTGMCAGRRKDVFYYSPEGTKFSSKAQLARYLGSDLSSFDYRTGRVNAALLRKKGQDFDHSSSTDDPTPSTRFTTDIFNKSVTGEQSSESDSENSKKNKPQQLFWMKRLEGMKYFDIKEQISSNFQVPGPEPVSPSQAPDPSVPTSAGNRRALQ
ncbi:MBD2 [Cordylochernes scorpioides]|uniref:MBD2 n=1 Tax=Cordylochernes scorpioides TaxID=51811 RepID=A0ABY6KEQ6_9ARAC|nr:MBD2 [Cordylochernes scorpioides]